MKTYCNFILKFIFCTSVLCLLYVCIENKINIINLKKKKIAVSNNFFSLICSQLIDKQNRARDFLLFKHFLHNLLFTVFMLNTLSKLVELLQ